MHHVSPDVLPWQVGSIIEFYSSTAGWESLNWLLMLLAAGVDRHVAPCNDQDVQWYFRSLWSRIRMQMRSDENQNAPKLFQGTYDLDCKSGVQPDRSVGWEDQTWNVWTSGIANPCPWELVRIWSQTEDCVRSRGILWRAPTKRKTAFILFVSNAENMGEQVSDEVVVCRIRLPAAHTRAPSRDEDLKVLQCCILRGLDLNICLALLKHLTGRKCRGWSWCGGRAPNYNFCNVAVITFATWSSALSRSLAAPAAACVAFHLNHNRTCSSDDSQMTSDDSPKESTNLTQECTATVLRTEYHVKHCPTQLCLDLDGKNNETPILEDGPLQLIRVTRQYPRSGDYSKDVSIPSISSFRPLLALRTRHILALWALWRCR